jgi:hypothetical protein
MTQPHTCSWPHWTYIHFRIRREKTGRAFAIECTCNCTCITTCLTRLQTSMTMLPVQHKIQHNTQNNRSTAHSNIESIQHCTPQITQIIHITQISHRLFNAKGHSTALQVLLHCCRAVDKKVPHEAHRAFSAHTQWLPKHTAQESNAHSNIHTEHTAHLT